MIDLHIHSDVSDDGSYRPAELAAMAVEAGLSGIALADHNSVGGVDEAVHAGAVHGLTVIPAVELDCRYGDISLHVLGYGIDHRAAEFTRIETEVRDQERRAALARIELVNALGFSLDSAEMIAGSDRGVVTGEMIAEALLVSPEYDGHPLLLPYRPGGPRSDNPYVNFYWDICAPGKPAHVPISFISLDEAVRLIHDNGGFPVLAHPGLQLAGKEHFLRDLAAAGVEGVEAYSSYHSPETARAWRALAAECRILVTCGSDFHGKIKPSIRLGCHGAPDQDAIRQAVFERLGK